MRDRDDQVVVFIDSQVHWTQVRIEDGWKFAPKGRFQFLQRWAWALLKRMKALDPDFEHISTTQRHKIEQAKFMDQLYKQKQSLFRQFNLKPQTLLIGSDDYFKLMEETAIHQQFSFHAEYYYGDGNGQRTIHGLTVQVIPWMTGMVVMP